MYCYLRPFVVFLITIGAFIIATAQSNNASTPSPSHVGAVEDIKFGGADVKLSGTLVLPAIEKGKRVPAVLIIGDSGKTTRDGVKFGSTMHPIYRDIAEHLAGRGIAALIFDRRCTGASDCKPAHSFDDYVDDARGALNSLRAHPRIDPTSLFVFGHGQGGLIAASIAINDEEKLAGTVFAAMAGRVLGKVLRDEVKLRMAESGKSGNDIDVYLAKYDRIIAGIIAGKSDFPQIKLDPKDEYDAVLIDLVKNYSVTVALLINDPLQIVINDKSPALILQGRKDILITVKDALFIEEALKRIYHPDVTLRIFDDLDHTFKLNKGPATLASYEDASRRIDPAFLKELTDWMEKRVKPVKEASSK